MGGTGRDAANILAARLEELLIQKSGASGQACPSRPGAPINEVGDFFPTFHRHLLYGKTICSGPRDSEIEEEI